MVTAEQILAVTDEIARKFKPQRIIVFGSYAYGTPTDDSDVDVLVVKRYGGSALTRALAISNTLGWRHRAEIHVRSDAEIRRRIAWGDFFLAEITQKGIVVHESGDRRMGDQGRRRLCNRVASLPRQAVAAA